MSKTYDVALCLCSDVYDEMLIREAVKDAALPLEYVNARDASDALVALNGKTPTMVFVDYESGKGEPGVEQIERLKRRYPLAYFTLVSRGVESTEAFWVRGADFLTTSKISPEVVDQIYIKTLSDRDRRRLILTPFKALNKAITRQLEAFKWEANKITEAEILSMKPSELSISADSARSSLL